MKEITRKCNVCKKDIQINNPDEDYIVFKNNKANVYCHSQCYIDKETTKKRKSKTFEECIDFIKQCKKDNEKLIKEKIVREELYNFLFDMYGIVKFPNFFFVKMESVFNGTMENLKMPVPPEDLLDMWKQKRNYLNKVAEQNRKKDNEITGVNRVNYDLAILLSKYDSYLAWKEKMRLATFELEQRKNEINIEYKNIQRPKPKEKIRGSNLSININDILDEI